MRPLLLLQALKDAPEVVIRADPGCSHTLQVQHWPLRVGFVNSALRYYACVNAAMFPADGGSGQMHNSTGADVAIGLNSCLDRCTCSDWRPCSVCADKISSCNLSYEFVPLFAPAACLIS